MFELTGRLANKPAATSSEWEKPSLAVTAGRMPIAIPTAASTTDCGSCKRERAVGSRQPRSIGPQRRGARGRYQASIQRPGLPDEAKSTKSRSRRGAPWPSGCAIRLLPHARAFCGRSILARAGPTNQRKSWTANRCKVFGSPAFTMNAARAKHDGRGRSDEAATDRSSRPCLT